MVLQYLCIEMLNIFVANFSATLAKAGDFLVEAWLRKASWTALPYHQTFPRAVTNMCCHKHGHLFHQRRSLLNIPEGKTTHRDRRKSIFILLEECCGTPLPSLPILALYSAIEASTGSIKQKNQEMWSHA